MYCRLLGLAKGRLELASSYWSLRGSDVYPDPSDWQGEDIYARLVNGKFPINFLSLGFEMDRFIFILASKNGISIPIAQNQPSPNSPNLDTEELSRLPGIAVKSLNFTHLVSEPC